MMRNCTVCGQSFTSSQSRRRRCDACRTAHDKLGRQWRDIRAKVLAGGPDCAMGCGRPATEVDHIIPLARGGAPYDLENLRPICRPCNASKGARLDLPAAPASASGGRRCPVEGCHGMSGGGEYHMHIPHVPPTEAEVAAGFPDERDPLAGLGF